MSLVSIFASAILPVIGLAFVGYLLGRTRDVAVDGLNTVTVYVLAPALVFHSIATTNLGSGAMIRIAAGVALLIVALAVMAEAVGRTIGLDEPLLSAFVLVVAFSNSGNYGIPLSEFAFGQTGRATAVVFLTAQSVLMYSLGVYVAARSGTGSVTAGVRRVFEVPLIYAVLAGLAARWLELVPDPGSTAMETIRLVGDSAIPVMLLILGIEVARSDYGASVRTLGIATALRMLVAPFVGLGIALAVGFANGTVADVFVLEAAAPSAVTPLILLIEFGDPEPVDGTTVSEFASTVVLVTTLVSVVTMTALIAFLQSGVG